jgi:ABC-type transport system substrate-binding protein
VAGEVNALLHQAAQATTTVGQDAIYNKLDLLLWYDAASLPLFQLPVVVVNQTRYTNLSAAAPQGGLAYDMAAWAVPGRS